MTRVRIEPGDCLEVIPALVKEGIRVDAIVTDPPYHLTQASRGGSPRINDPSKPHGRHRLADSGFMGKQWDGGDIAFCPETWRACLNLLKPGGHLLAFGLPKTFGFMQVALTEAGFEVRDTILWLFGSGFPKSHNLDGDHKGWGTALKPAAEFIALARKPLDGTVAQNVKAHGTGAINIDGCRVEIDAADDIHAKNPHTVGTIGAKGIYGAGEPTLYDVPAGRWPANVIHDGSPEVLEAFPDTGKSTGGRNTNISQTSTIYGGGKGLGQNLSPDDVRGDPGFGDTGTAARFFYSAKADAADRLGSRHPTVKPVDLMAYLCRMVTPPGGTVLDPFAGSGTTAMACLREGFDCILIEREDEYIADIRRRLDHVSGADTPLFASPE